jgi:hypothetical protein
VCAVGDAVSEGDDGGTGAFGLDVDAFEELPGVKVFGVGEVCGDDGVAGDAVVGLVGGAVIADLGATLSGAASLTMRAPGGMTTEARPPKVRGVGEVMALPSPRRAMEAASMVRGSTPNSLVRTTRTAGPPMEMWTISRRVTPVVSSALSLPLEFFSA